jgi:DNA-binding beta-propeller fold protein YncE
MDEATMRITDSIPVSIGIPIGVQLSYDRKHFYVQEPRFESVEIFDVATRKSLGSFTLSSGNRTVRLSGMSVDPTERFAVMVVKIFTKRPDRFEISTPKLLKYDLATRTVTDTIPWPRGEERDFASVMFSPDGENMYFFTGEDVLIYDTKTLKQVERWEIARAFFEEGFGRLPTGFATQQLYEEPGYFTSLFRVTDPVNRRTLMGIARTNLIQRSIDWFMLGPPGPSAPGGITLAPGRKRAYGLVQQVGNWQFWTFDLENKRVLNKIEFKGRPRMSITAGTDGKVIYLHGAGSTVDVRDVNTFEVIRTIELPGDMTSFMLMPPAPRPSGPGH